MLCIIRVWSLFCLMRFRQVCFLDKSKFFEILIFSQDIWGSVYYVPEINLIS